MPRRCCNPLVIAQSWRWCRRSIWSTKKPAEKTGGLFLLLCFSLHFCNRLKNQSSEHDEHRDLRTYDPALPAPNPSHVCPQFPQFRNHHFHLGFEPRQSFFCLCFDHPVPLSFGFFDNETPLRCEAGPFSLVIQIRIENFLIEINQFF